MPDANVSGKSVPTNDAAGYDNVVFTNANNPRRIIPLGTETDSIAIRALSSNGGTVYLGFDENITAGNGFPLQAGDSISIKIDTNRQGVFALTDTAGDELRWIALS